LVDIFVFFVLAFLIKCRIGPLAIATPGELLAYHKLYQEFGGGVPWPTLFTPTIRLCEKGFNVSRILAFAIKENEKFILNDTQLR